MMTEPKLHYRLPPCPAFDIPGTESWLQDMAAKGLHLAYDGIFLGLAHFEEGPPKRLRFRLEATATEKSPFSREYDPEDGAVQLLESMGWTYRARRGQFHIYTCEDPNTPELNTDPQVQAMTMGALTGYLYRRLRSVFVLIALHFLLFYSDLVFSSAVWMGSWWVLTVAFLLLSRLGIGLWELLTVAHYQKKLKHGRPLTHRRDYRSRRKLYFTGKALWNALYILMIFAGLSRGFSLENRDSYVPLDTHTAALPFATIQDLHPSAQVDRQQGILKSELYSWSDFLAPENYDMNEYAQITLEGRKYDCYLTVTCHRTRWEWTARVLAGEMTSQAGANLMDGAMAKLFGGEPTTVTAMDIPGWDQAVYYHSGLPEPYLVLRTGTTVLRVRYTPLGQAPGITPEELARLVLLQIR